MPLYKNGFLVGGIGVTGDGSPTDLTPAGAILFKETQNDATTGFKMTRDKDELVALAGQTHFRPSDEILATNVLINGIRIPYVHPRREDIEDISDVSDLGKSASRSMCRSMGSAASPEQIASGSPQESPAPFPYEEEKIGNIEGEIRFVAARRSGGCDGRARKNRQSGSADA